MSAGRKSKTAGWYGIPTQCLRTTTSRDPKLIPLPLGGTSGAVVVVQLLGSEQSADLSFILQS
eukprot:328160-Amphidinium_carterae.1